MSLKTDLHLNLSPYEAVNIQPHTQTALMKCNVLSKIEQEQENQSTSLKYSTRKAMMF